LLESSRYREALADLGSARQLDYERVMELKRPVIEALHQTFVRLHRDRDTPRGRAYALYLDREGDTLEDFATFLLLSERLPEEHGRYWRRWPSGFRHPRSREVAEFRQDHFEEFDRHRFMQFELDRQLAAAANAAQLSIGVYGDLAIGSASDGSDTWAFPDLFLEGAKIGAPPDDYSLEGQDWGLPPLNPHQLKADRYRYWVKLLRSGLRHYGALRIDHVMGLLRQYWVPAGRPATEGAYVIFPHQDLLGILALESQRHGAVIVGEDLGTVPTAFSSLLARWGILSTRLLYFEKDRRGQFRPARSYSKRALVTASSHDNPPLLGWWEGRDLELRRLAGSLAGASERAAAEDQRESERAALLQRLKTEGLATQTEARTAYPWLVTAVHNFLARTPAPLIGLALDDLAGERDPINLPGVQWDRYASWTRRIDVEIESLRRDPGIGQALAGLSERRADGKPARLRETRLDKS
jgi:4-alpha-glucanotransferase